MEPFSEPTSHPQEPNDTRLKVMSASIQEEKVKVRSLMNLRNKIFYGSLALMLFSLGMSLLISYLFLRYPQQVAKYLIYNNSAEPIKNLNSDLVTTKGKAPFAAVIAGPGLNALTNGGNTTFSLDMSFGPVWSNTTTFSSQNPIAFTSQNPSISIANGGSLSITDGSNTLLKLTDSGTTGSLTTGSITITGLGQGIVKSSSLGLLSSSAINVGSSDVSGVLPVDKGGTGADTHLSTGVPYVTSGTWTVDANALAANHGGTGQIAYTTGDILYASAGTTLSKLNVGTSAQCLIGGTTPSWGNCSKGTILSPFTELNGAIVPNNITNDLLIGGQSTDSATFHVFANGDASMSGSLTMVGANSIQTTSRTLLTLGGNTTGDIQFKPGNSSSSLYLSLTGNVGIGTTSPQSKLDIVGNTTSNEFTTINNSLNIDVSSVSNSNANYAQQNIITTTGSNNVSLAVPLYNTFYQNGSGTINQARGIWNAVRLSGTGTIGEAYGTYSMIDTGDDGHINNAFGEYINVSSTGTSYGLYSSILSGDTGYGVYIADVQTTSQYGLYQAGVNDLNYFAGNVGIGTTSPLYNLQVMGGFGSNALVALNQLNNGDIFTASSSGLSLFTITQAGNVIPGINAGQDLGSTTRAWRNVYGTTYYSGATTGVTASLGCVSSTLGIVTGSGSCPGGTGVNWWNQLAGALSPVNTTNDLVLGATSTSSALFSFTGVKTGQTIASVSGNLIVMANNGWGGQVGIGYNNPGTAALAVNGNVGIGTTSATEKLTLSGGNFYQYAAGNPTVKGSVATTNANGVYVSGKYAYVADSNSGLRIIDISNPSSPSIVGTVATTNAESVYVSGKYAYVADSNSGLRIIDISNPSSPSIVGTVATTYALDVYVSGKYAYVADSSSGLRIIDISNPSSPSIVGTIATTNAESVYVSGKYAYVAAGSSGLRIIDISNPSSPSIVGTVATTYAWDVYVSGKYAYVADLYGGVKIINVSDPTNLSLTGTYSREGTNVMSVYVSGKYAYFGELPGDSFFILDISNPASPVLVGSQDAIEVRGVYVSGKYAYAASSYGLYILDINGIETPSLYAGNIATNDITVTENLDVGNNLYVRNGLNIGPGGLYVDSGEVAFNSNSPRTAVGINQNGIGDLFTASASGSTRFVVKNAGTIIAPYYTTCTLKTDSTGLVTCGTDNGGTNWWNELAGALSPVRTTDDFLLGSTATSSALFSYTGIKTGQTIASASGNLIVMPNNGWGGQVGIGTTAPRAALDVVSNSIATSSAFIENSTTTAGSVGLTIKMGATTPGSTTHLVNFLDQSGRIRGSINFASTSTVAYATSGIADFAEFLKKDPSENIDWGEILCENSKGNVEPCAKGSSHILGVSSEFPTFVGGENLGDSSIAVGLVGLVLTKVSNQNGNIQAGDYITSSTIAGVGAKAIRAGQVVGVALSDFSPNSSSSAETATDSASLNIQQGKILVRVSPSWYDPAFDLAGVDLGSPDFANKYVSLSSDLLQTDTIQSLTDRVSNLEQEFAVLSSSTQSGQLNSSASDSGAGVDLTSLNSGGLTTIPGDLEVKGNGIFDGMLSVLTSISTPNLMVSDFASFFGDVIFNGNVKFNSPPTFDTNTAGIAIIKKGADRVNILFDKSYQNVPLITTTISFDNIQVTSSADQNSILENHIKIENYSYFITRKTTDGFTIVLNKPANEDINFSWVALSIDKPNVSESGQNSPQINPGATQSAAFQSVLNQLSSSSSANK